MDKITQEAYYRQRMLRYLQNHGVTETANRYHYSRKTVWKWQKRYDGSLESLKDQSRRPIRNARKQSPQEIKIVTGFAQRYKMDLIRAWDRARTCSGYSRTYWCFKRTAASIFKKQAGRRKRKNKPYERAGYPGQKVQVDVKFVPCPCVVDGKKYYVYVAVDECSRWSYHEMYDEHSTYSSADFVTKLVKAAPFPIRRIQTDNGTEFTNINAKNNLTGKTMFEQRLEEYGIEYQRIRIATPRHNGKVERQNRIDGVRFYSGLRMFSLADGRKQLTAYQRKTNKIVKICLDFKSPDQILEMYRGVI